MIGRLLRFRIYLIFFAFALYLFLAEFQGAGPANPWLAPAVLVVLAVALSRTRLQIHRIRGHVAAAELAVFAAILAAPPLAAALLATAVTAARLLLERTVHPRSAQFGVRLGVAALDGFAAVVICRSLTAGQSSDSLAVGLAAVFYLFVAGVLDSLEDRVAYWRRLLPAASVSALCVALLYAPAAVFIHLALGVPGSGHWTIAPALVALYWFAEWWLGPLYDDQRKRRETDEVYLPAVEALALAVEAKDSVSSAHLKRVQRYCVEIAKALNCTENEIRALEFGALLHDIGKIAIPEVLLTKPGKLSPQEFSQMAIHPQVGAEILSAVNFPFPVAELVLSHHENWDGTGYPRRLEGEQIPLTARILSVVDAFDALTSDRPYRPAMSVERALDIIKSRRGKAFEPRVTDTLIEILPRIEKQFRGERAAAAADGARSHPLSHIPKSIAAEQTSLTYEERIESLKQSRPIARQRSRHEDLTAWYRLLSTLGASMSPQQILDFVTPVLGERIPIDECAVFLTNRHGLAPIYCTGPKADLLRNLHVPIGDSPTGWVAGHGETLINGNPMRECADLGTMAWLLGLNAALVSPLWEAGKAVGTINLYSKTQAIYSHEHAALLETLVPTLGGVLVRAHLYAGGGAAGLDPLTNLAGARQTLAHLSTQTKRALEQGREVAAVYIDIDDFRFVNARLGHSRGDQVLLALCRALHDCFEDGQFLGRLGDDHFVGVLNDVSPTQLASFVKRLKMTVREESSQTRYGFDAPITISVGTANFPREVNTEQALLVLSNQRSYLDKISRSPLPARYPLSAGLAVPKKGVR